MDQLAYLLEIGIGQFRAVGNHQGDHGPFRFGDGDPLFFQQLANVRVVGVERTRPERKAAKRNRTPGCPCRE